MQIDQNVPPQLSECDKEQIQFIDLIQPIGALIATDSDSKISYAALGPEFGLRSIELLGKDLEHFLGPDAKRIAASVEERSEPTTPILFRSKTMDRWITCIGHQQGDLRIFELEHSSSKPVDIPSVKFMKERRDTLGSYLSYIAENIQIVTGYDRVMIYKFAPDWHGEVVAEALNANVNSFYGHHFPASDIPVPARNLFTQLWVRMIVDIDAEPLPVVGQSTEKLDLTKSILRATSPIHIEYLRNMGVAASLTLSLICDGKLWGLIACHHFSPRRLAAEERSVCSLLAKLVSSRITSFAVGESIGASKRISEFTIELEGQLASAALIDLIRDHKHSLLKFVDCDGFSFVTPTSVIADGHAPDPDQLLKLVRFLNKIDAHTVYTTEVSADFPQLKSLRAVSPGILAFKVGDSWCIWTRKEIVRSILWAGDPNKPLSLDKSQRISPRQSFDAWRQEVKGKSLVWEDHEIHAVERLRQVLLQSLEGGAKIVASDPHAFEKNLVASIKADAATLNQQFKNVDLKELDL